MDVQMDMEEADTGARSLLTRQGATTAGGWNHSKVFSEAASQGATLRMAGRQTARSARAARTSTGTASRAGTRQVCASYECCHRCTLLSCGVRAVSTQTYKRAHQ